jgi:hypothetical protein
MASLIELHVRIIPWDDSTFVQAFERAREEVRAEGMTVCDTKAAARAEELLRAAGFRKARVDCVRTTAEALAQEAHWIARRDGA